MCCQTVLNLPFLDGINKELKPHGSKFDILPFASSLTWLHRLTVHPTEHKALKRYSLKYKLPTVQVSYSEGNAPWDCLISLEEVKKIELDEALSERNKLRMRELFDAQVENGSDYRIAYAYSEDISGTNFAVLRTVSYKYRNFVIGFRQSDLRLVFLEVTLDLSEAGQAFSYTPQEVKKTNYVSMVGSYYLQYGSSFKKEFFNFFVPETIDEIVDHDWYDEETFVYVDQPEEHAAWVSFWNAFSR